MFFGIILVDRTKLCIPASWLQRINIIDCINNLNKRNEKKVIFYSNDEAKSPDFSLPITSQFDACNDACYFAYVLKAFETREMCNDFLYKRRAIAPVFYGTNNSVKKSTDEEVLRQMAVDQKCLVKMEVNSLRQAILQNRMIQCIDLTESEIEDYRQGLDEPISIEEEHSILQDENQSENPAEDCLSGNIPFLELSVRE